MKIRQILSCEETPLSANFSNGNLKTKIKRVLFGKILFVEIQVVVVVILCMFKGKLYFVFIYFFFYLCKARAKFPGKNFIQIHIGLLKIKSKKLAFVLVEIIQKCLCSVFYIKSAFGWMLWLTCSACIRTQGDNLAFFYFVLLQLEYYSTTTPPKLQEHKEND